MTGAGFGLRGMSRSRRGRGEVLPGRGAWRGTAEWVRDPRRGPETKRELPVCAAAPQRDPQGSLWPPLHRALRPQPWSQWLRLGEATLAGGLSFCAPENLILGPDLVPADPSPLSSLLGSYFGASPSEGAVTALGPSAYTGGEKGRSGE